MHFSANERIIRPGWATRFPNLIVAQSTRLGGHSTPPYAALNLGWYTDDDQEVIVKNRRAFAAALGIDASQLSGGHQVHGAEVAHIQHPRECTGMDAFISNTPGTILAVTVADCVPVLLYDPTQKAWGAAHAGWRGTVAGVVPNTLNQMMAAFGSRPEDCWVYIGVCISRPSFEVSRPVAEQFPTHLVDGGFPDDKFRVDLKATNAEQLMAMGVQAAQIEQAPYCTVLDNDRFFSYRKEGGQTGRMLGVIGLR